MSDQQVRTTIYMRSDQAIVQQLYPQQFSEFVRQLADSLIQGIELDQIPPELAEEVVYARREAQARLEYLEKKKQLKADFWGYLDQQNYPVHLARYGKRKAKKIGKLFAEKYRMGGNILPECYIHEFLNEYLEHAEYSGQMTQAWIPIQEKMMMEDTI